MLSPLFPVETEVMSTIQCTVLFEDPFWVAIFERADEAGYAAARTVFGAEPTAQEVYEFILQNFYRLPFSQPLAEAATPMTAAASGFKRAQRESRQAAAHSGVSTKAQEVLRLEFERHKKTRRSLSSAERDAERERQFQLWLERKKEKKRGH
jgi:hypothetical protein